MDVIIGVIISVIGSYLYRMDFCTLYTFITIGIAICRFWLEHTNDKTALK